MGYLGWDLNSHKLLLIFFQYVSSNHQSRNAVFKVSLISSYTHGLSLYSGNISKSIEELTPKSTENPCLISESPPYPNGWTKEQVKKFNEQIRDQPCRKI